MLLPFTRLEELGIDREVVAPVHQPVRPVVSWSRIQHGIPAVASGEADVFVFDPSSMRCSARADILLQHPTVGLLVSPRLSHLACRFWLELVDWDEQDAARSAELGMVRQLTVQTIAWRELLQREGDGDDALIISLPGFEHEVVGSLLTALEQSEAPRLTRVGFISLYRDGALVARLEELGFAFAFASAEPDDAEPVLWVFERPSSECAQVASSSIPRS